MNRPALFLCCLCCLQPVLAADCQPVEAIQPGFYARQGQDGAVFSARNIANTGFIIGTRAVAVIDTGGSPEEGAALLCAIRKLTELPVRYVINTHVHPDHLFGNSAFRTDGVSFIGHKNLPRALALLGETYVQRAQEAGLAVTPADLVPPDQTVGDTPLTLDLGERRIRIEAVGQSHTDNDLTVLDESTNTRWLGDLLFHHHIPVLGGSGSVNGWLDTIRILERQDAGERLIPGHGPLQTEALPALEAERGYLEHMRAAVRAWLQEDKPLAEGVDSIGQQEAATWPMAQEYHKRNISYLYSELEWE
ncbi:MAG TPA: quinoprotein relay system zinc metallohydrolase 2 [Thiolinea sp.]|nr:quinoprotein relay system zinc metallohydrolase 2 [Thiolinea sp.]